AGACAATAVDDGKSQKPAAAPASASVPAVDLAGADFVVLVWYRGDDALETFKYQVYDVRKGEYTGAVDDWVAMMRRKFPGYVVRVRRVVLAKEQGATDSLKVGSVIHRELIGAAAMSGIVLGEPLQAGPGLSSPSRPAARTELWSEPPGAGGQTNINPVDRGSPFPVPYPRPHP
ncbi:MAG: hypothetical protein ACYC61_15450, partial [Isosphaeraceae bacterium]